MQLSRFLTFCDEIQSDAEFPSSVESCKVFRIFKGIWHDELNQKIEDPDILTDLNDSLEMQEHWRRRGSRVTYFPVDELKIVVQTFSNSPPRVPTRNVIHKAIRKALKHANHKFDASHCPLTGVLNGKEIDNELRSSVRELGKSETNSSDSTPKVKPNNQVVILSLDLDFFKQVNDSFGHDYGDIVLIAFAQRIGKTVQILESKFPGLKLLLGRPGGEEFTLFVKGSLPERRVLEIAESVRAGIAEEVIPTDADWDEFPTEKRPTGLTLPHLSERRITASIGVSSVLSSVVGSNGDAICANLRREADTAVYRAKAGGRNTFRLFSEIRSKHGAIVEFHEDTGIVVIDIGKNVNVAQGQEYHVYHPDFVGGRQFIWQDGRTSKTLGFYPRRACGRIVVFDSQQEISFCTVSSNETKKPFVVGSLLEIIPVGSITHLIESQPGSGKINALRLAKLDDFQGRILELATQKLPFSCVVFNMRNSIELESARGVIFINGVLLDLFDVLLRSYPGEDRIAQISPTMLAVVFKNDESNTGFVRENKVIDEVTKRHADLPVIGAGVFSVSKDAGDGYGCDVEHALEFARFCASGLYPHSIDPVIKFSPFVVSAILSVRRQQSQFKEGVADYIKLKGYGLNDAYVENQAGLLYLEDSEGDLASGLSCIRAASDMADNPSFLSNLAIAEWLSGDWLAAYSAFEKIETNHPDHEFEEVYLGVRALASCRLYTNDSSKIELSQVLERLAAAAGKLGPVAVPGIDEEVASALAEYGIADTPPS